MASIGKKILSAFVDLQEEQKTNPVKPGEASTPVYAETVKTYTSSAENNEKFTQYFDKLFRDANLPGPDYFEFAKMIEAMSAIPDEKARYAAAFAGLNVQGLDKTKLLSTAAEYLRVLTTDANNFNSTVDAALQEKVHHKKQEITDKANRIEQLTREISALQQQMTVLNNEIKQNEEKIENNSGAYKIESEKMKMRIEKDIEKIKQHIH